MKNILIFLLLLAGCSQTDSITGVYVKHVQSEYTIGEDSLFISTQGTGLVLGRHTTYQRTVNGRAAAQKLKRQVAFFEKSNDGWLDVKTGVSLNFKDDKAFLGSAEYQKVK
ncbi:MAG TPA: hypothetical protein VG738_19660 [Chitinophagaceae bacterium]|nr:hypothetical protein [Chitinophagaceae bacterium]